MNRRSKVRLQSTLKTMKTSVSLPRGDGDVDVRLLSNGMYRYRFRLTALQRAIVDDAVELVLGETGYLSEGAALDALAISYVSGAPTAKSVPLAAGPTKTRLFRLYADQHVIVRGALKLARQTAATDADALTRICAAFIAAAR